MIKCLSTSEALVGYSQQLKWRISGETRSICCCGKGDKCLYDEMLETHIILLLVLILLFTFFVSLILQILYCCTLIQLLLYFLLGQLQI